jgi:NAD(P)H-dependent FMN reductase
MVCDNIMTKLIHLVLINGSLRAGSTHGALLKTALGLAPPGTELTLYDGTAELPHFNPDDERDRLPPSAAQLRALLAKADGVLFCTPEYAGALPGSFKNLLDWTVGEGLHQKPVAYINASPIGSAKGAHQMLRVVLGYVNADVIESACVDIPVRRDAVAPDGVVRDPEVVRGLRAALEVVVEHIRTRIAASQRDAT